MSGGPIQVTGKEEVIAGFDAVQRAAADLSATHRAVVERLIPQVRSNTPRRTGALAVSWRAEATPTAGSVQSPLDYALPLEVGTRFIEARRMVTGAIDASEGDIAKGYEDGLAEAAKRAGFRVER